MVNPEMLWNEYEQINTEWELNDLKKSVVKKEKQRKRSPENDNKTLTEEQYYDLCNNKLFLSDNEMRQVIKYTKNQQLKLNVQYITDNQAKQLQKIKYLYLDWLKNIVSTQVVDLCKNKETLSLTWVTEITDYQAELFSNFQGTLNLWGLKHITDSQAKSLSKVKHLIVNKGILTLEQKEILKK